MKGLVVRSKTYKSRLVGGGGWSIGANAMRSVLALGLLIALCASANAARVITPNRDMSLFVPARVWTHTFRRSSKTRPLATTIHPSLAAADLRRPERIARNRARTSHVCWGQTRHFDRALITSGLPRWSQPVDATLYLKEKRWSVTDGSIRLPRPC